MFDQEILDALPPLARGGHSDADKAVCAMEALARSRGMGTTDSPPCVSPVIGAFVRTLNDSLPDPEVAGEWGPRDRIIRPLLPRDQESELAARSAAWSAELAAWSARLAEQAVIDVLRDICEFGR